MSADYYACTVIGTRIEEHQAYQPRVVKAYEHNHPANWKVDPVTGRKLWREEKIVGLPYPNWNDTYPTNNFTFSYMQSCPEKIGPVYVGICRQVRAGGGLFTPLFGFSVEDLKLNLKTNLEPLGLWNESNFGIWTFDYVSY